MKSKFTRYLKAGIRALLALSVLVLGGPGIAAGTDDSPFFDPNQPDPSAGNGGSGYTVTQDAATLTRRLYSRLASTPPDVNSSDYLSMLSLISGAQEVLNQEESARRADWKKFVDDSFMTAAAYATLNPGFLNHTMKSFATPLSTRTQNPLAPLNDFTATFIGMVRDEVPGREIFTGDYVYSAKMDHPAVVGKVTVAASYANNTHYQQLQNNHIDLQAVLVPVAQSRVAATPYASYPEATAGLLTSRGWMVAHDEQGTGRRKFERVLALFLCAPIESLRNSSMSDVRVRQDVTRNPGGVPEDYHKQCRSCHAGLDGLANSSIYYDWKPFDVTNPSAGGTSIYNPNADTSKLKVNLVDNNIGGGQGDEFPDVVSDEWVNNFTQANQTVLAWNPNSPTRGNGLRSLAQVFADSGGFPRCMARRAIAHMCNVTINAVRESSATSLAASFITDRYNFRKLFQRAAILPECMGR